MVVSADACASTPTNTNTHTHKYALEGRPETPIGIRPKVFLEPLRGP